MVADCGETDKKKKNDREITEVSKSNANNVPGTRDSTTNTSTNKIRTAHEKI